VRRATLVGEYADVGHHEPLAELRTALAGRVVHHRLHDLDAGTIRLTASRAFTQDVSRHVFGQTVDGQRRWNWLAYRSKHGDDLQNWAIFEPSAPAVIAVTEFEGDDADLAAALALHGLQLG
jgi:hypothetical protein